MSFSTKSTEEIVLQKHYAELVRLLAPCLDDVLVALVSKGVISIDQKNVIKKYGDTPGDKVQYLLDTYVARSLSGGVTDSFVKLLDVMKTLQSCNCVQLIASIEKDIQSGCREDGPDREKRISRKRSLGETAHTMKQKDSKRARGNNQLRLKTKDESQLRLRKISSLEDAIIEFKLIQVEIRKALCCSNIDVDSFIHRLRCVNASTDKYFLPMFDDNLFTGVDTLEALWEKFEVFWFSFLDCHVLKIFLQKSRCDEAIEIYRKFSSKLKNSLEDVDLEGVYKIYKRKDFEVSLLRIKVQTERCVKAKTEIIYKIIAKTFKIQKYALHLIDIKKGSIELVFKTTEKIISHFETYEVTGHVLRELAEISIVTLQIKDTEIRVPDKINEDDEHKVFPWVKTQQNPDSGSDVMKIFVQTWNKDVKSLKVRASDTIENVKLKILDKLGIPPDEQQLLYEEKQLEDSHNLHDCGILEESTIDLLQFKVFMETFVVQTWNGSVISLEARISDTIGNVKSKISDKLGIPADDLILLYEEQPLQDGYTLLHYEIQKKPTLDLRQRLKGDEKATNNLTAIADLQFEFYVMTEKIKNVLRTTKDVTVFREELQLMYAVIDEKIPLFEKDMFSKVETFDSLWEKLSSCWSIYDYDLLMQIVKTSDSEEAKLIFQDFVSKIDSFTEGVDLVLVSALHEKKENKGKNPKSVLRIKVDAKRCNCYMKNKIKKFLHKHYKLEKYALHFKEITKGCIEINFKVSEKTLSYIEQYPTYGYDVPKFLNLKIKSIRIENRETKIVRVNADEKLQWEDIQDARADADVMKIFVLQTWNGNVISLEVRASDPIGYVKFKISDKLGISPEDQILLYKEQLLQDDHTLLDYRIPEKATLHLRLRLRGGVFVKYFHEGNDKTIRVEVNESDTVGDIKTKVQNQERISTDLKSLWFNGKRLNDTRLLLLYYNIQDESTLNLKDSDVMKIFVLQTWNGNEISLEVRASDTIGNVKLKISDRLGIPAEDQILLYKMQPLQDVYSLRHYGISEKSTLDLRRKLKGGIFVKHSREMSPIRVAVDELDTVRDIKTKVQKGTTAHLRFAKKRLDDNRILVSYYEIQDESMLDLEGVLVFIKLLGTTEKSLQLEIETSDTISTIKEKIQVIEGIPTEQQILMLSEKELQNNSTISDYKIQSGSIIMVYASLAQKIKSLSTPIHSKDFTIPVYKPPMKTAMQGIVTKCTIGEPTPGQSTVKKMLIVIGVIGAGKTSLINAMVNYILGVSGKDEFRFKLASNHNQIKTYTIYPEKGSPLDFTLTIIDIPEFQDISSTEHNDQIIQQIQGLFEGSNDISSLSGISIVTRANLPQSDPVNTYIFRSILSIFGNDLAGNIFMVVTSANHQYPPVITAISEASIPFTEFYKFDDSTLYIRNDDSEGWSMNFASFHKFFLVLSRMPNISLDLTKSVLQTYKGLQLKDATDKLTTLVDNGVSKLKELNEKEDIRHKYENDISNCKEFTSQVKVVRYTRVYNASNQCVTVCTRCNYTCHDSCGYRDDNEKYNCGSMRPQGDRSSAYCIKCPGKCFWNYHANLPYHYEEREEMETIVDHARKTKYHAAQEGKTKAEREIEDIKQCLKTKEADAINIINEVQNKLLHLDSIVLLPNPLTVRAHLLQLIKIETNQQRKLFYKQQEAILKAKEGVDCLKGGESDSDPKGLWYAKLTFKEQS